MEQVEVQDGKVVMRTWSLSKAFLVGGGIVWLAVVGFMIAHLRKEA